MSASPPGATTQPCSTKTHWVEIVLLGENHAGISDERYLIITADGAEYRGKTGTGGLVRLDNIVPGDCQVSFPDLDAEAWRYIA